MIGSARRAQLTEQVTGAVKSAGTITMVALVVSGVALIVALAALLVTARRRGMVASA